MMNIKRYSNRQDCSTCSHSTGECMLDLYCLLFFRKTSYEFICGYYNLIKIKGDTK